VEYNQDAERIHVERYKTELMWFILVLILSITTWIFLAISVIGIIYALMIALFLFVTHIGFIAHVRGSAVRISSTQFPDLYNRIEELSSRIGIQNPPTAYIMQAGGTLNALATKLFRSKHIILYSDLLEACADNEAARDMIIGHELGHFRAGHLTFAWLLLPGLSFPFIGTAYSRAREYTCDRYGAALCGDKDGALQGLAILSAGAKYGPMIDLESFVKQKQDLNTGLMTIGKWLSTHPSLSERVAALDPLLLKDEVSMLKGKIRATAIVALIVVLPIILTIGMWKSFSNIIEQAIEQPEVNAQEETTSKYKMTLDNKEAEAKVESDLKLLSELVQDIKLKTGSYPTDEDEELSSAWSLFKPDQKEPIDPFDGNPYGYYLEGNGYVIWSIGPDGSADTEDDIIYDSTASEK
jgi:Zn-dependent protease with chaperone function